MAQPALLTSCFARLPTRRFRTVLLAVDGSLVRDEELAAITAFTPTGRAAHGSRHNAKIVLPRKLKIARPRRLNLKKEEELSGQELEEYPTQENGFSNRRF